MTVAILGYGRFGRALGSLLLQKGQFFRAYDPTAEIPAGQAAATAQEAIQGAEWVVLAMPVPRMEESLKALRPSLRAHQTVLDVGSVKVGPCQLLDEILGDAIPHVGSHPLFGPLSLARAERPLRVVLCPSPRHPGAARNARTWFEGLDCEVLEQDPETHDRNMAQTHVLAFFVAKGLLDVGVGDNMPIAPPSFQGLKYTLEAVRADAGHLFAAIQRENPFAAEARERLVEALAAIHRRLAEDSGGEEFIPMAVPDLRERSPELREVRDLIDDVDRELLELLHRRTQLAQRAARAKAQLGAPILDPVREATLLQDRRAWAAGLGLDENLVEEVFRALLRGSRRAQVGLPGAGFNGPGLDPIDGTQPR
jgi:prephenate dehydrogenase